MKLPVGPESVVRLPNSVWLPLPPWLSVTCPVAGVKVKLAVPTVAPEVMNCNCVVDPPAAAVGVAQVESPRRKVDDDALPDPSRAVATVPVVTFAASKLGISAATNERKVGVAALPVVGPLKTRFAFCVASVP